MRFFFFLESNVKQQLSRAASTASFIASLDQPFLGLLYSSCRSYAPRGGALLALLTPRRRSAYREGDMAAALCSLANLGVM